ncbi:MAG: hypothetical protein E6G39_02680 [Actinobacteria bacterium]|nr:MAG: hypothetical protein E6G39_02680 [Actinomycetota bacterium]
MSEPRIIDGDGHVVEPDATFRDFLPAKFASYAPRIVEYDDHFRIAVNDNISYRMMAKVDTLSAPGQTAKRTQAPVAAVGASDPAGRIRDLDLEGFERAVLFPTYGLMVQGVTDRAAALALCRAINEWLAEYCRHDPFRLIGAATLPMIDVDDAIAEARRTIENDGFRAAFRRPEVIPGAPMGSVVGVSRGGRHPPCDPSRSRGRRALRVLQGTIRRRFPDDARRAFPGRSHDVTDQFHRIRHPRPASDLAVGVARMRGGVGIALRASARRTPRDVRVTGFPLAATVRLLPPAMLCGRRRSRTRSRRFRS